MVTKVEQKMHFAKKYCFSFNWIFLGKKITIFFQILQNIKIQWSNWNEIWKKIIGFITSNIFFKYINVKSALPSLLNNLWFSVSAKIKKISEYLESCFSLLFPAWLNENWITVSDCEIFHDSFTSSKIVQIDFLSFCWPSFNVSYFHLI